MSARTVTLAAMAGLGLLAAGGPLLAFAVRPALGAVGAVAVLLGWAGLLLLAGARLENQRQLRRRVDRIERVTAGELPRIVVALEQWAEVASGLDAAGRDATGRDAAAGGAAGRDAALAGAVGAEVDAVLARRLADQRAALQAAVDDRVLGLHELVRELRTDAPGRPGEDGEHTSPQGPGQDGDPT